MFFFAEQMWVPCNAAPLRRKSVSSSLWILCIRSTTAGILKRAVVSWKRPLEPYRIGIKHREKEFLKQGSFFRFCHSFKNEKAFPMKKSFGRLFTVWFIFPILLLIRQSYLCILRRLQSLIRQHKLAFFYSVHGSSFLFRPWTWIPYPL